MTVRERIEKLRELMRANNLDAYIIPSADAHQSEYVAEHWKCRQWISGFTGSAGTVVIKLDSAGLWADGRYYIQAAKQIEGSGIDLFKMGQPDVPTYTEWLKNTLKEGSRVAIDGKVLSVTLLKNMEKEFKRKKIQVVTELDFISEMWNDRPEIPKAPVFVHDVKFAGKSRVEKVQSIRKEMKDKGANYYLLSSLDDIAWLLNIRGGDVPNNPVVISYVLISENKVNLFIDAEKLSEEVIMELKNDGIEILPYNDVAEGLKSIKKDDVVFIDPNKTNAWLYKAIDDEVDKVEELNITTKLKAIKNEVEIENLKRCQVKDGVAMVKFMKWLKGNIGKETITEISADEKLQGYRSEQENFLGISFDTIAGYKDHAAMMHYKATPELQYKLKTEGFFLVDSGGQYLDGTTDITRTFVLGPISEEEKRDFTLVLKSHIGLNLAKFLYGATGSNLDILARKPMWDLGLDYKCGTGHGVGFLLNVHEGPQGFSQVPNTTKLEKGMIITNEPGIYKEGKHGIRTENTILVVEDEKTDCGQFMKFETISYCPIDLDGVDVEMLTIEEKNWLNVYHNNVYSKLSIYLNDEEKAWLKYQTREI